MIAMRKLILIALAVMAVEITPASAPAADLLGEIDGLMRLISLQSGGYEMSQPRFEYNLRTIIDEAAERHDLDPALIEAIIKVESNYNPRAVSSKGAMGLMQLMPATAREIGVTRPFDPSQNVLGGSYYYRLMLERYGDHRKALWAYNCGPGCVDRWRMPDETKSYIRHVVKAYKNLKKEGNKHE